MSTKAGRARRTRSWWTTTAALAATATAVALGGGGSAVAQDCAGADAQPGPDVETLAAAVECLVNQERVAAGVARVPSDARLVAAAQAHAREMVDQNAFSTTGPDGSTPAERARRAGYPTAPVGETIAFGTGDLATPRRIVAGWMADPSSRARLMAARGAAIGSAAVTGTPGQAGSDGATYVVDLATTSTGGTGGTVAPAVAGKTAVIQAVRGTVYVLAPGGTRTALRAAGPGARAAAYRELSGRVTIPMGSRVDTRVGTVKIATAADRAGTQQSATFRDGIFRMTQARTGDLVVNFQLVQPLVSCGTSRSAQAARKQGSPRRKTRRRSLFGSGKGRYRTRGRYASATVRGTQWTTTDSCAGTKVTVRSGVVDVRDTRTGQVVAVRAGRSILVPRKRTG